MDATEVIRQIDKLPAKERAKVVSYVRAFSSGRQKKARYVPRKQFEETANRVFDQHAELFKKLAR